MTQETVFTPAVSPLLPDAFSHALMQMVKRVQPSIVQVIKEGRGAGTGIVWEVDGHEGYIITDKHVVPDDSTKIQVHLADGRSLDASALRKADGMVVGVKGMFFGGDLAVSIPSKGVSSGIAGVSRRRQMSLGIEGETVELPPGQREKAGVSCKRGWGLLVVALETDEI